MTSLIPNAFQASINTCHRKDMQMFSTVEEGIRMQSSQGRQKAVQFMLANKVPCEVAVRVLCRPAQRRSPKVLH